MYNYHRSLVCRIDFIVNFFVFFGPLASLCKTPTNALHFHCVQITDLKSAISYSKFYWSTGISKNVSAGTKRLFNLYFRPKPAAVQKLWVFCLPEMMWKQFRHWLQFQRLSDGASKNGILNKESKLFRPSHEPSIPIGI